MQQIMVLASATVKIVIFTAIASPLYEHLFFGFADSVEGKIFACTDWRFLIRAKVIHFFQYL